jgi:hypothetical protein
MKRLIPAVVGALFFAAFGPLVGAIITLLAAAFGNGNLWTTGAGQHLASSAGLVFLIAYIVGIVPAFFTGVIACALFPRVKSLAAFLGVCVLANVVASGPIGYAVYRFFGHFEPNAAVRSASDAWFAALVLIVLGLIPALVVGAIWYRRQPRDPATATQPPAALQ